jgi:hypothetical protein
MLGRQGWCLLTEPSSLCARVLKGRYYPDCDFWHAQSPRSASFTWRSILFGRELLQQGVQWGIGTGQNTKLLTDKWIPRINPEFIHPLTPLPEAATMDFLIDDHSAWNTDMVNSIFEEGVATQILQVPISRYRGSDFHRGLTISLAFILYVLRTIWLGYVSSTELGVCLEGDFSLTWARKLNRGRSYGQFLPWAK